MIFGLLAKAVRGPAFQTPSTRRGSRVAFAPIVFRIQVSRFFLRFGVSEHFFISGCSRLHPPNRFLAHYRWATFGPAINDDEYFSDGLSEEIINALVKVPGLTVIARTSAFAFKGQNTDIRKIAELLGVTTVLEGSVRRAGNRIRVTAQLITAADGSHLWSECYDRQMEDIFEVQDEIARAIAEQLKVTLGVGVKQATKNLEAYELYLKGRRLVNQRLPVTVRQAIEAFEEAIKGDPDFALAYSDSRIATASFGRMGGSQRRRAVLLRSLPCPKR